MRLLGLLPYPLMTLANLLLGPPAFLLSLVGWQRQAYALVRLWCRLFHLTCRTRFTVRGLERVPREGSYVVVSNHSSHLDGPTLILALPHPIFFVIKRELARVPIWGQAVVKLGFIAIDRTDPATAHEQLRAAVDAIRSGRHVLVFPEGTRSPGGHLLPFKKGGFHLAVDAQVPILPVAVNRSRQLLPKGRSVVRPGVIEVEVGEPIPTAGLSREAVGDLLVRSRAAIAALRSSDPDFVPDRRPGPA